MVDKQFNNYIIITLEIIDGERSLLHELFAERKKGESVKACAERNAKNYFGDGRKVRNEEFYESSGGELLIKLIRFVKVENTDAPVIRKYFTSI